MPRKGRGGARQGTPGTAYGNRTDLNEPISTVPNQGYGMAKQQSDAQRVIPMAASPVASVDSSPAQTAMMQPSGRPLPRPGEMPYTGPTNRPNEPVTAGLPFGPGPGPEALNEQRIPISQQIQSAARNTTSPALAELAAIAGSIGV